jgi:hypothetical protein
MKILLIACALLFGALGLVLWSRDPASEAAGSVIVAGQDQSAAPQVPAHPANWLLSPAGQATPAAEATDGASPNPNNGPDWLNEDTPTSPASLDKSFARESVDPAWSMSAETNIGQAMRESGIPLTGDTPAISCRTTVCILKVFVDGEKQTPEGAGDALTEAVQGETLRNNVLARGMSTGPQITVTENGRTEIVSYYLKKP